MNRLAAKPSPDAEAHRFSKEWRDNEDFMARFLEECVEQGQHVEPRKHGLSMNGSYVDECHL